MNGLFDTYRNKATNVPYNDKEFLPNIKETQDVIVIGATNDHTFELPFTLDEVDMFWLTYVQGTETKITKQFEPYLFEKQPDGTYKYPDTDDVLYELSEPQVRQSIALEDDPHNPTFEPTYSVLFHIMPSDQSVLFNDYNKEVYVQIKASYKSPKDDLCEDSITYSKTYKLKVLGTLRTKKPILKKPPMTFGGFAYTED